MVTIRNILLALVLLTAAPAWAQPSNGPYTPPVTTILQNAAIFGSGADGNVTISSGAVTLTRDMQYANLTISGTGALVTNGYRVFVSGLLNLSAAPAGAIQMTPGVGGNASGATGDTPGPSFATDGTLPWLNTGGNGGGGTGGSGNATTGTNGSAPNNALGDINGGSGGNGGAGGSSTSSGAAGISGGTFGRSTNPQFIGYSTIFQNWNNPAGTSFFLMPGMPAGGGGQGGGDGTNAGGGGGGGGRGGGFIALYAASLQRSASTGVGAIQAKGAEGTSGAAAVAGNAAGGGGGGGGGGGFIYMMIGQLLGTTATNMIDVSGGNGGNGAGGSGTGTAGGGGLAGIGGNYQINVLSPPSFTVGPFSTPVATAPSGATGGTAATVRGNL